MSRRRPQIVFGWILLILGGLLFLDHWYPHLLGWNIVLITLGIALIVQGITRHKAAIFPGTFLFLLALFFTLKEAGVVYVSWWQNWPLIILFLGVSFIVLYIVEPTRRTPLIIGIVLIAISFIFLKYPYRWDDVLDYLGQGWPIILILVGIRMIWKALARRRLPEQ